MQEKMCSSTTNTTRAKWVIITVMMIITNHPSREKIKFEQIICWLIPAPHPAHGEKWIGSGWAANNDKLSIPEIILTIIIAVLYFAQWWKWSPWAKYKRGKWGSGIFVIALCKVISHHVRFLFHQGPVLFRCGSGWQSVIYRWSRASRHPQ